MSVNTYNANTKELTPVGGAPGLFSRTHSGVVPAAPSTVGSSGDTKFLREDGTWQEAGGKEWVGTSTEWGLLSTTEKAKYEVVVFTDDNNNALSASQIPYGQTNVGAALDNSCQKLSGTIVDPESVSHTTVSVNSIGYDATNNQLILKTGGADTVVPFKRGGELAGAAIVVNNQNSTALQNQFEFRTKSTEYRILLGQSGAASCQVRLVQDGQSQTDSFSFNDLTDEQLTARINSWLPEFLADIFEITLSFDSGDSNKYYCYFNLRTKKNLSVVTSLGNGSTITQSDVYEIASGQYITGLDLTTIQLTTSSNLSPYHVDYGTNKPVFFAFTAV